jgi:hypothetical protein
MSISQSRVNDVADDLRGTTKNLEDFATDEECEDLRFLHALDDLICLCDICGWWCDKDEEGSIDGECAECCDDMFDTFC